MEIRVLNTNLVAVDLVENLESFIWTERYDQHGEFEIYAKFTQKLYDSLQEDYYLRIPNSDRTMVIEDVSIKNNFETGDKLKVTGRSVESMLDRRIILEQIIANGAYGSFHLAIENMMLKNVVSGTYPERNFTGWLFSSSMSNSTIANTTLVGQYGAFNNLYETIQILCEQKGLGFKVILNSSNQFVFSLYSGLDRSYAQIINPYIVFSRNFDNLISSEYTQTKRYKKNYALVSGELDYLYWFDGAAQVWSPESHPDLLKWQNRREMFIDGSNISKTNAQTGNPIPEADWLEQLRQRGRDELAKNVRFTVFDFQVDTTNSFKYGSDYFLGDIVQIIDDYGHVGRARVVEMTFSENLGGISSYPTLKPV